MKKLILAIAVVVLTTMAFSTSTANAQEAYLGDIKIFAGNFAPRGWAFCDGQLLPISSNTALFSILGTTYGGDGRTTFALPDLRNAVPVGVGRRTGAASEIRQGSPVNVSGNSSELKGVGLRYIICMQGLYPSRS